MVTKITKNTLLSIIFFMIFSCSGTCCLNCNSYSNGNCAVCNSNYYLYNSLICVSACPSGYIENNGICSLNSSLTLINIDFSQEINWNQNTIGTIKTADGNSFNNSLKNSLIPTKSQGFYSKSNTKLIGTSSWIPSPDLTISCWVLIKTDGHIIELSETSSVIIRTFIASSVYGILLYLLHQSSGTTDVFTYTSTLSTTAV